LTLPQSRPATGQGSAAHGSGDGRPIPFLQLPQQGSGAPAAQQRPSNLRRVTSGPPVKLGQYQILAELGRGGMGIVYKGLQEGLQRHVGLKVLPEHLASNPDLVMRFKAEARAAGRLNHPNIAGIYEMGEDAGTHFFAMEYISGHTLSQVIATHRQVPFLECAQYVAQSADALAYAHRNGVVHRDIKPSNIMLTEDNHIKVMDFGLARIEGDERLTMSGMTLGTPAYMSPEQAGSETAGPLDHRSDIYSLGVVLYELLTGRLPFDGKSKIEILRKIVDIEPLPPHTYRERVPPALERIVMKAMAKRVADRYSTAAEMRDDLRGLQLTSATTSIPSDDSHPAPAASKGKLAAAAVALALLGMGALYFAFRPAPPAPVPLLLVATPSSVAPTPGVSASSLDELRRTIEAKQWNESRRLLAAIRANSRGTPPDARELERRLHRGLRTEAISLLDAGKLTEATDLWFAGVEPDEADIREIVGQMAPELLSTAPGTLPWAPGTPGELLTKAIEKSVASQLAGLPDLARVQVGEVAEQTGHLFFLTIRAAEVAMARKAPGEAAACWLALAENASGPNVLREASGHLASLVIEAQWTPQQLGLVVVPLRGRVPLPPASARPASAWQHLLLVTFALNLPQLPPADSAARTQAFAGEAAALFATPDAPVPSLDKWRTAEPGLPPLALSPSNVPRDRLQRIEGALMAAANEAGWTTNSLVGLSSTAWPLQPIADTAGLPFSPLLPQAFEGSLVLGDGNNDRRRMVVLTDGRGYLLFADFNGNGDLADDWPASQRYPLHPAVRVTGKFGIVSSEAMIFSVDPNRRLAMAANTGWREGAVPPLPGNDDAPLWLFRLYDVDGDGLYNDFGSEARTVGARGAVGPSGQEVPLYLDVPFRQGERWIALADMTSLGTETYWTERTTVIRAFALSLAAPLPPKVEEASPDAAPTPEPTPTPTPEPPPLPKLHLTLADETKVLDLTPGTPLEATLPVGTIDLLLAARGYVPLRYFGASAQLPANGIAAVLDPFDIEAERTVTIPMEKLRSGSVHVSLLTGTIVDNPAAGIVAEIALRKGGSSDAEIAAVLPRTLVANVQGTIVLGGSFIPPSALQFAPMPLALPITVTPLGGELGYRFVIEATVDEKALVLRATPQLLP